MSKNELRASYIEKLHEYEKVTGKTYSESSIRSYAGAVTARGELSGIVRAVPGLMPAQVSSLLELQEPEAVSAVVDWWQKEGLALHKKYRRAMELWITVWQGINLETPRSRSGVAPIQLQPPPYGVRLVFLLQAFFDRDWQDVTEYQYNSLLEILSMNEECECGENGLKEHTAAFRNLHKNILLSAQQFEEEIADRLVEEFSAPRLMRNCKSVVEQCLAVHGAKLLRDMAERSVNWEKSLFPVLQRLYFAEESNCGKALVALVCKVLEDHDPGQCRKGEQNPAEVSWEQLWNSRILWQWLETVPPDGEVVHALLQIPKSEDQLLDMRLTMILFCAMQKLAGKPHRTAGGERWDEAEAWMERALQYMDLHWNVLKQGYAKGYLPTWGESVEADHLEGGPGNCLFRAEMLVYLSELALGNPVRTERKQRWGNRLMKAREALRQAEIILQNQLDGFQGAVDCVKGRNTLFCLLARQSLCEANSHLQLAQLEEEECALGDAVQLYIYPARLALENGQDVLDELEGKEGERLRGVWERLHKACCKVFFSVRSPVVKRLGVLVRQESEFYQQEFGCWKESFHTQGSPPVVFKPLDPAQLQNAEEYETVYCSTSDSVLGKDEQNQESMELTLFQQIASGKTCVLQMNQAVDNRNMLRLMPTPGFRQACREGVVTLSCFGQVNSPRDYLINCLKDPDFVFSSSVLFNAAEAGELAGHMRRTMLEYLDPCTTTSIRDFAWECREEAEFLTESYRILFECFQPSDLRRHHQNEDLRFPPRTGKHQPPVIQPLNEVIAQRLQGLIREAEAGGTGKNLCTLRALQEYAVRWKDLTARSHYDAAIDLELKLAASPEEKVLLEKFRRLVYQCYFLSNGRRSCQTILLTESDPDLIRSSDAGLRGDQSEASKRLFYQSRRVVSDSNLSWQDICEVAMIVREIDIRDRKIAADRRVRQKAAATGLVYSSCGAYTMACGLTPKTSAGNCVEIAQGNTGKWSEALELYV